MAGTAAGDGLASWATFVAPLSLYGVSTRNYLYPHDFGNDSH